MLVLVSTTFALILWLVLWAIGAKALDAFMLSLLIIISAAAAHIVLPYLPGNRRPKDE